MAEPSVYLIYSAKMEEHSPGKLSALKEIALAQEMARYGAPGMGYLYMGFYIHSCQKMRYKGQYAPSYLLEPVRRPIGLFLRHPLTTLYVGGIQLVSIRHLRNIAGCTPLRTVCPSVAGEAARV